MNIEQINEALARIGNGDKSHKIQDTLIAVDAARRFVDGWETCPTCKGEGKYPCTHSNHIAGDTTGGCRMYESCPDCVDGMVPGPQLVERAYAAQAKGWAARLDGRTVTKLILLASRREEQ